MKNTDKIIDKKIYKGIDPHQAVEASRTVIKPTEENQGKEMTTDEKPLLSNNFMLMGAAAMLIVLGFLLISGGQSDTDAFNPDIFSARRIVVGPMLSFLGFILMAIAIVIKPKSKK